ncbi:cytochrome C [Pseudodesulfovibrio sp. F-1]|uniref:Cytochrome C n=1 Tax=Pseudodesulfovibrio alkaliphilus TaxID=2661613 RepID=A0A7K1KPA4_9BACT|nr:cytochrome c3 family protein [Pseudodesulfovibrio alkaliphilus]MUM77721.1 cytochrome C [Pseudodesulfovibrio alkaliphilus]
MKKSLMICLMVAALVCVFALPAVIAGAAVPETVTMKAPDGVEMTRTEVVFPHKAHEGLGIDCFVCHHTNDSKDSITGCSVDGCHSVVDLSKDGKKDPTGFYAAFHGKSDASCLQCHKNEKKAGKNPPVACKDCHK